MQCLETDCRRNRHVLTDAKARKIRPIDKPISDPSVTGLYLFPSPTAGTGKWVLRFVSPENGRRRDMGLGSYPVVSLRDARERALEARQLIADNKDPIEQRSRGVDEALRVAKIPTFEAAARNLHADLAPGFRNAKHRDQWLATLVQYVFPTIGRILVNELRAQDFATCLKPIWLAKPETASRVKQRCDAVMISCAALGFVVASPVGVVNALLPKQPGKRERVEHQPALPWRQLPEFVRDVLHTGPATDTKAMLELLILTGARSGEVRMMTCDEIDFAKAVWTIPASRMKTKVAHRVPLSARAITILEGRHSKSEEQHGLVFPSRKDTAISDMTLTKFLRDRNVQSDIAGRAATAHGFRSSFRDWASEHGYPRDLAERALAHTVRNATEAAYHRTDLLEQRRGMMSEWEEFILARR